MNAGKTPLVSIVMGSQSDYKTMKNSKDVLIQLEIPFEVLIVSAHRTPDRLYKYAKNSEKRGLKAIIAGAGGAAHLPGMIASMTNVPVLGVPIEASLCGIDSLLSIVQMPGGVPVATFSIGRAGAKNAAIFACKIVALNNEKHANNLKEFVAKQTESIDSTPRE